VRYGDISHQNDRNTFPTVAIPMNHYQQEIEISEASTITRKPSVLIQLYQTFLIEPIFYKFDLHIPPAQFPESHHGA